MSACRSVVIAAAAFLAASVQAQTSDSAERWVPRRTPDGQPDLQGTWVNFDNTPFEPAEAALSLFDNPVNPPTHWADHDSPMSPTRRSMVVEPPDGRVHIKKWAEDKRDYDLAHLEDAPQHETPWNIRLWNGDPRGHWEGNTLVVETTNFNDKGVIASSAAAGRLRGIPHSEEMHVVERFTRVSEDVIHYSATVTDPKVYETPWTVALPLNRDESYAIFEYSCHEGNLALPNALRAGRVRDGTLPPPPAE